MSGTTNNSLPQRRPTLADQVAEQLALDLHDAEARVASLEADVVAYRELTLAAIAMLADLRGAHRRLQKAHYALLDEYRLLRKPTMRTAMSEAAA
jgi:hypothetical protein